MSAEESSTMWVPKCCGFTMRHNSFGQHASELANFVCTNCGKHINLEPASTTTIGSYGKEAHIIKIVAAPRPPKTEKQAASDNKGTPESDDLTL